MFTISKILTDHIIKIYKLNNCRLQQRALLKLLRNYFIDHYELRRIPKIYKICVKNFLIKKHSNLFRDLMKLHLKRHDLYSVGRSLVAVIKDNGDNID